MGARLVLKRVWHPWQMWECYPAGFWATTHAACNQDKCERRYAHFLNDLRAFESAIIGVFQAWPRSCEHWLTNAGMNRVAWIGQASACYWLGLPARHRSGYKRLPKLNQAAADELAQFYLNEWLRRYENRSV
jgi:hypothetical protein